MRQLTFVSQNGGPERRVWLVERAVDDRDMVTLIYATPDGTRAETRQLARTHLHRSPPTAAITVPDSDLDPVEDTATKDRYAAEVKRVKAEHDPDDQL